MQRERHLEAERGARAVHAGEQVQGGHRLLRAHRQEELRLDPERVRHRARQPLRELHHDQPERGGRGAHAEDREGGGAAGLRGPGPEGENIWCPQKYFVTNR